MRTLFICISMVFANVVMAQQPLPVEYQTATKKLQQYVSQMLVRNGETIRWSQLPQLKVTTSDPVLKKYVELTFAALCQETGITEVGEGVFHVYIGSQTGFLKLDTVRAKNVAFRRNGYWYWTNSDGSLKETLVMASYNEETDASTDPAAQFLFCKSSDQVWDGSAEFMLR